MIVKNSFMQFFSFKQFEKIYNTSTKLDLSELYDSLDKFLIYNNLIKPFKNHVTHRTNFGYYWDKYLNDDIETYQKEKVFSGILDKFTFMLKYDILKYNKDLYEAYDTLTNKITQGNFEPFELTEDLYDFESGEQFNLKFQNWEPLLVKFIPASDGSYQGTFEMATEEPIQKLFEFNIEFKTANLIVADWFKIQEFTNLVDINNNFDINCEKGRIEQSQYYLNHFNFIHTPSWNDSQIYQNNDTFIFIQNNEQFEMPDNYKLKGKVDKELRALSIIEKQHLINLIGNEKLVNDYLEEYKHSISQIKVNPGIYSFTIAGSPESLKSEYKYLKSFQNIENKEELSNFLSNQNFIPTLIMRKQQPIPTMKIRKF